MVPPKGKLLARAFTRVELLCTLAALALLVVLALPALAITAQRSQMIECLNNLRRVGVGFHCFANEHDDLFPCCAHTPDNVTYPAYVYFTYLRIFSSPAFLVCPSDSLKTRSISFDTFNNNNLSYFIWMNAEINTDASLMSGDRNLSGTSGGGFPTLSATNNPGWDSTMHVQSGNLLFAGGSANSYANNQMSTIIQKAIALNGGEPLGLLLP
jgi:hypothetical protein